MVRRQTNNMKLLTNIIFVLIFGSINSQTSCTSDNLFGKWTHLTNVNNKVNWTREIIGEFVMDTTKFYRWTLSFDSSFAYNRRGRRKTKYILNQTTCKITYKNWPKDLRLRTDEIIYLDQKYLILRIQNPHSSTDNLFIKN